MAKAAAGTKSKLDVVSEILNQGITRTAEIVATAKSLGVEISPATVANYKHQLLKGKAGRGRKSSGKGMTRKAVVVRDASGGVSTNLEVENLALRLIVKAGSADKARQVIDRLS